MYKVHRLGAGWYDFKDVPQEGHYIKVHGMNCGDDKAAIRRVARILNLKVNKSDVEFIEEGK